MLSFPAPTNVKALQRFLGMINYYRKFIPNFAKVAQPLYQLLVTTCTWHWNKEQQTAFDTLKKLMSLEPVLAFPDFTKPFIVSTDASKDAIGCILKQLDDEGQERVIQYGSRTLNAAQRRYNVTVKEGLAIKFATVLFRPYLHGNKVTVYRDPRPLTGLLKTDSLNSHLSKWRTDFQGMDITIVYRPGNKNADADALYRIVDRPDETDNKAMNTMDVILKDSLSTYRSLFRYRRRRQYLRAHPHPDSGMNRDSVENQNGVTPTIWEPPTGQPLVYKSVGQRKVHSDGKSTIWAHPPHQIPTVSKVLTSSADNGNTAVNGDLILDPIPSLPLAEVANLQTSETWSRRLIQYLDGSIANSPRRLRRKSDQFLLQDNLLYYKLTGELTQRLALVVPKSLRANLLHQAHDSPISGHLGRDKTWKRLKSHFYWPGLSADVRAYVQTCPVCNLGNVNRQPLYGEMHPIPPAMTFLQRVSLDKVGPCQNAASGKTYFFAAVDNCTRYKFAAASIRGRAIDAAHFLMYEIILRHTAPKEVITDNGSEFTGPEFTKLLDVFGIQQIFTSPRHPQSNGMIERDNGSITHCIRKLVDEGHTNWDVLLPHVVYALNTSVHDVTGFSPFFLVHGVEPRYCHLLPTDPPLPDVNSVDLAEAFAARKEALKIVAFRTRLQQARDKERHDARHNTDLSAFVPGQKVYVETRTTRPGFSERFNPRYTGPSVIIGPAESPVTFWIEDMDKTQYRVHVSRLRLCPERPSHLIPTLRLAPRPPVASQNRRKPNKRTQAAKQRKENASPALPENHL